MENATIDFKKRIKDSRQQQAPVPGDLSIMGDQHSQKHKGSNQHRQIQNN